MPLQSVFSCYFCDRMKKLVLLFLLAVCCSFAQGQNDPSLDYFNKGLENYYAGNHMLARELFTLSLKTDAKNELAYYNRGMCSYALQNYQDALSDFRRTTALNKQYTNGYIGQAVTYIGMKQYAKAVKLANKALEVDPASYLAHYNKGLALYNLEQYPAAMNEFDNVLMIRSGYADAFVYKGLINYSTGNDKMAVDNFTQAINNSPESAIAYYNRALARLRMDYKAAACEDLSKSAELGYESAAVLLKVHCKPGTPAPAKENK